MAGLIIDIDLEAGDLSAYMGEGDSFGPGMSLYSPTGAFRLTFQSADQNLVLVAGR